MMGTPFWLIGVMLGLSVLSGLAPIYIKRGSKKINLNLKEQIRNYNLIFGCFLYGITILLFVPLLKFGELSILYPVASSSYIWASVFSVKMLKEKMNSKKWAGIVSIIAGVLCITLGTLV